MSILSICGYVREFILSETEQCLYRSEIDWTLEELWVKEYLDDCETVNEFGFRGFVDLLQKSLRLSNSNSVVENANFFVLNLLNVYFNDEQELCLVIQKWKEKYEVTFKSLVYQLYQQDQTIMHMIDLQFDGMKL